MLLLHDFDLKKGGSSQQAGWADLAASLQKDGFTVLSFDFRGFGDSKNVDKEFWSHTQNGVGYIRRRGAEAAGDHRPQGLQQRLPALPGERHRRRQGVPRPPQ